MIGKVTVGEASTETFYVRIDPEDKYFAVGSSDGSVHIYNTLSGKLMSEMLPSPSESRLPITCVK